MNNALSQQPRIIGVAGNAGSGKDTVADHLVKNHGFVKVALADPLKRICREVFNFSEEQLWGPSEKRNEPDKRYPRTTGIVASEVMKMDGVSDVHIVGGPWGPPVYERTVYLTPRHALQQLGTEWGRACYPNIWVEYALRVAIDILKERRGYSAQGGLMPDGGGDRPRGVVIPDVRFRNEVDAIRAAGGKVWRVSREGAGLQGDAAKHQSETDLDTIPRDLFAHHVSNNRTLESLYSFVDMIVFVDRIAKELAQDP